jgi:hypothetical protein
MDQFRGTERLIGRIRGWLRDQEFDNLRLVIAFAKAGPLFRLAADLEAWRKVGGSIEAIFGIDHRGTSQQALQFALQHFDQCYVTYTPAKSTFHPKFYLAYADDKGVCVIGSHNLTVGGTETNLESGIQLELTRPDDEVEFQQALLMWTALLPDTCALTNKLDAALLEDLLREGLLCDEASTVARERGWASSGRERSNRFKSVWPLPPSAIPVGAFVRRRSRVKTSPIATRRQPPEQAVPPAQALVIQIRPHHNGEVFLSKLAVNQNPGFFGFPFTGLAIPKKSGNPPYPQRVPDPVVDINVFDRRGRQVLSRPGYGLNTVYYEKKAEIRITLSPEIAEHIPEGSLMVMRQAGGVSDYDIEVYAPGSSLYRSFLAACNQTMPSGGAAEGRRMGWL